MPGGRPTPYNDPVAAIKAVQDRGAELIGGYRGSKVETTFRCLQPVGEGVCGGVFAKQWQIAFRDSVIRCRSCVAKSVSAQQVAERAPKDLADRVRRKGGEVLQDLPYVNAHTPIAIRCRATLPTGRLCEEVFQRTPHSLRASKVAYCVSCTNRHIGDRAREPNRLGYTRDQVQAFFAERGAKLLTEHYVNVNQKLDYVCGTPDCGNVWSASMQAVMLSRPDLGDVIECKDCQDANRPRGSLSPQYREDLSDEDRDLNTFLRSRPQVIWAKFIRFFYGQHCLIKPNAWPVEAHHIMSWNRFADERFLLTNGVPLCEEMHDEYHSKWAPGVGDADLGSFQAFFQHHTGREFVSPFEDLVPELIQPIMDWMPADLLRRKAAWASQGKLYVPLYPGEVFNRREVVRSMLLNRLGKLTQRVGARELDLAQISPARAKHFFAENHIQGYAASSVSYALVDGDEIYSACLFTPLRVPPVGAAKGGWELVRMAHKIGWVVPGGASKLLSGFRKSHPDVSITTYADRRFCASAPQDTVYPRLGFRYLHASRPSYRYTNREGTVLQNKKSFQRKHLPDRLGELFDPAKSEAANMRDAGYLRLWDCGTFVFQLNP